MTRLLAQISLFQRRLTMTKTLLQVHARYWLRSQKLASLQQMLRVDQLRIPIRIIRESRRQRKPMKRLAAHYSIIDLYLAKRCSGSHTRIRSSRWSIIRTLLRRDRPAIFQPCTRCKGPQRQQPLSKKTRLISSSPSLKSRSFQNSFTTPTNSKIRLCRPPGKGNKAWKECVYMGDSRGSRITWIPRWKQRLSSAVCSTKDIPMRFSMKNISIKSEQIMLLRMKRILLSSRD